MNKHLYRIVFNKARGLLMVVGENVRSQGQGRLLGSRVRRSGALIPPERLFACLSPVALAAKLAAGTAVLVMPAATAQIIADPNAPATQRPTVLNTANGLPQVNIQTPSAAGVSRNTYSQFDVQSNGAILNNSRTNTQTQTGGWVQANPWLAGGSARVILNEVNSTNPSHLRGYVEIAGQRAEVIIANPAGIRINGGGFINADRVTLVTGHAHLNPVNGDALDSYRVTQGTISIDGLGLDTRTASYTEILARSVEVNAGIWADRLKVVTGANEISATNAALPSDPTSGITPIAGTGPVPGFSLDVAAIGGMYAGHIYLIGSEAGMGVRNLGTLSAGSGNLVLTSNGYLTNQGAIQAASAGGNGGDVRITTAGALDNSGANAVISAQGATRIAGNTIANRDDAAITAGTALDLVATQGIENNEATIAALGSVTLDGASLTNASGLIASVNDGVAVRTTGQTRNVVAAGSDQAGRISAAGDINLHNAGLLNQGDATHASSIAGRNLSIDTNGHALDNGHGTVAAAGTLSTSSGALNNAAGLMQSAAGTHINTHGQIIDNTDAAAHVSGTGGIVSQADVRVESGNLKNEAGYLGAAGAVTLDAGHISNAGAGQIMSQSTLDITAASLDNRSAGQIQALGNIAIDTGSGTLDNRAGLVRGGASVSMTADTVLNSNTGGADQGIEGMDVAVDAGTLANAHGAIRADDAITVTSSGSVDNSSGLISAVANVTVQDAASNKTLAITNTGGTLIAGQRLAMDAASLSGDGQLLSVQDLDLALTGDYLHSGKLHAGRNLAASARNLSVVAGGEISATSTTLTAQDTLTNRGLIDGVNTRINAVTLTNIGTGRIYGDHVGIAATTLNNDSETVNGTRADAVIAARERLDIGVQTLNNREHALIFSAGTGENALNIGGALDQHGHATGHAASVTNSSATIESLGDLNLASTMLNNTNAHFSSVVEQVSGPTGLVYIQPSGSATKLLAENFVWEGWSRAGQYRYVTAPPPNNSGILGQSPVPRVGEQDCVGEEPNEVCTRLPGADYLSNDPAWTWFGITPPAAEPAQPVLAVPVAPDPAGASTCQAGAGYNESACTAYTAALATYTTQKQTYDTAWASYTTAHAAWQVDTDARYDQLDNSIEAYNQTFAHLYVRAWTQFDVTRTESESKVASSDPGQILSGGAMRLTGGDLVNDKSRIIAGGTLSGDLANLRNIEAEGVHVVHESGTSSYTYSDWRGGFKRYHQRRWDSPIAYAPADQVSTITLAVTERRQNTAPAGSGTQIVTRTALPGGTQASGAGSADASAINVLTLNGPASLPSNSLFQQNPNPGAHYLIETDPRFTDMRQWLGSNYMLAALGSDPSTVQKRLGDGFYEQKLIREQVAQLTGRRFLDGYGSDEAQYLALMDAGISVAQEWNLVPGVALSAAQMAQLTSDIVWLVSQEVTLADGSKQTVLVPQVYLQVRDGDLGADGTLLAGASVNLNLSGDLANSGTIAGRNIVHLTAQNLNNLGGRITGTDVAMQAREDLNNIGGQISARNELLAVAGRDLNVVSTTQSTTNAAGLSSFSRAAVDRVAGLYVTGDAAGNSTLIAAAGRDVNVTGAAISNSASQGSTLLQAARDINLGTVHTAIQEDNIRNSTNYLKQGSTQDLGSQIVGAGSIDLVAGQDIHARAATVNAGAALTVLANRDITISAGEASSNFSEARQHTSKSLTGSKTRTTRTSSEDTAALASSFGGESVLVQSGRNTTVLGSNVIADADLAIVAGNDLTISAAETRHAASNFQETKKSGLFSSGGLSVTLGKQEHAQDMDSVSTHAFASTVGAIDGNVIIAAGGDYRQTGSHVVAPAGDILISAGKIDIEEARETSHLTQAQSFKQSGLTVAITSPVLNAIQTVQQMAQASSKTSDPRMQLLAGATSALAVKGAAGAVMNGQNPKPMLDDAGKAMTGADGEVLTRDATAAEQAGGINLSISIGSSKSQSTTVGHTDSAVGSTVIAGGDILLRATGAGTHSNLTIQGSTIKADGDVALIADNQIKLLAAANTSKQHTTSSSKSGSIGISFGTDGFLVNAGASAGKGKADGETLSWTNAHVEAGNTLVMQSGGDTMLKGAVAMADRVLADIGGNLTIESLQDISRYDSKQQSVGGSISVGLGRVGGSFSASKSSIDSDYASVVEQSGIKAGDGGYQVDVGGNATLVGGVIAASDQALQDGKTQFSASGDVTLADIANQASYSAKSAGISIGGGASPNFKPGLGAGLGKESDNQSSVTQAGIGVSTSSDTTAALTNTFDANRVQGSIDAQTQITMAFSREAPKAAADFTQNKRETLKLEAWQAEQAGNPEQAQTLRDEAARWDEGGSHHALLQALVGGLGGGVQGALGAGAVATSAPLIEQITADLPLPEPLQIAAGMVLSSAIGAAAGGTAGVASGLTVDVNNRGLHSSERKMAIALAKQSGGRYSVEEIEAQLRQMPNLLMTQSGAPEVYANMQDPDTQQRWLADREQDSAFPIVVHGSSVVETQGAAKGDIQAFIVTATTFGEGPLAGQSPYLMTPAAAKDLLNQVAQIAASQAADQPRYHGCASTECLLMGANYNPNNPQNRAELQRREDILKAAGVIVTGPALAFVLASPQGQVALQTLLWNKAATVSGAAGAGANATAQYLQTGEVKPLPVVVAGLTGGAGGGTTNFLLQGSKLSSVVAHSAGLATVIGANAAGAAVTGGDQGPTAVGATVGYGIGLLPSPFGPPLGAMAQEFVTWWLSMKPTSQSNERRSGQ